MHIRAALSAAMILAVGVLIVSVSSCNSENTSHNATFPSAGQEAAPAATNKRSVVQAVPDVASTARLDCAGKDRMSNLCRAYVLITGPKNQFGPQKQLEHLGAFGEVFYKSKQVNMINQELSKLDDHYTKASALVADSTLNLKLKALREKYDSCAKLVIESLGTKEDIDAVTDSCSFEVQRSADTLFAEMGVKSPSKSKPDVFDLAWGESRSDVLTAKGQPAESTQTSLTYKTNVAGNDALAYLVFINDKLARLTYVFTTTHTNNNLFTYDFESVDSELRKKYGHPAVTGPFWRDDLYKGDRSQWGMAVATGRMSMASEWTTATSTINHRLIGDNFNITHGIDYRAREFALAISRVAQKQSQSNL